MTIPIDVFASLSEELKNVIHKYEASMRIVKRVDLPFLEPEHKTGSILPPDFPELSSASANITPADVVSEQNRDIQLPVF
jgi:hypothetical protein